MVSPTYGGWVGPGIGMLLSDTEGPRYYRLHHRFRDRFRILTQPQSAFILSQRFVAFYGQRGEYREVYANC